MNKWYYIYQNNNLGRKKNNSREVSKYNKYFEDNLIRKSKKGFNYVILDFINSTIMDLDFKLYIIINNKEDEGK